MRVGLVVQAKMALVLGLVDRLAEGAQHHGLDNVGIGSIRHLAQQLLVVQGRRLDATPEIQTELPQEAAQALEFFLGGPLVHPVQGRQALALEQTRRRHIGRKHAFLDELVGIVALAGTNALDLAVRAVLFGDDGIEPT